MPTIKFETKREADHYRKVCHSAEYVAKLRTVKSRYFSMDEWKYKPCYVVVQK